MLPYSPRCSRKRLHEQVSARYERTPKSEPDWCHCAATPRPGRTCPRCLFRMELPAPTKLSCSGLGGIQRGSSISSVSATLHT
jgi:hypothetical protein